MGLKTASLNIILEAVGKLTGDQLLANRKLEEEAKLRAEKDALPRYFSGKQRRALKRILKKSLNDESNPS